jgi:hypothetical protein
MVRQIDDEGIEAFTMKCIEGNNPELLQAAHYFASRHRDYLGAMQGLRLAG